MPVDGTEDLELMLRRVIREEAGISAVPPAEKWRDGTLVLRPGTPGLQEKTWPIETFFHKVVMLRNRLRTLEQHVNSAELSDDVKVKLRLFLTPAGRLASEPVLIEASASLKGPLLMQSAIKALEACQPYAMLPADRYGEWKVIDLSFAPKDFAS